MTTTILRWRPRKSVRIQDSGRDLWLIGAVVVLGLLTLASIFAPLITPFTPDAANFMQTYQSSTTEHWFGTDSSGRDIFSRVLWGGRISLVAPLIIVIIAGVLGTAVGIATAVTGGVLDRFLSRILDIGFAFPGMLLAILAVAMFGAGITPVVIALAIAYVPFIGRMVRNVALAEMALPYVEALLNLGQSRWKIAIKHILPAVLPTALAQITVSYGYAMVDLAAMSFLGMGVQPPTADWGLMISEGQRGIIQGNWEESIVAGVFIVIAVAAVSLIGDRLADRVGSVKDTQV